MQRITPVYWDRLAHVLTPLVWLLLKRRRREAVRNIQYVLDLSHADAVAMGKASFHSNLLVLFETLALPGLLANSGVTVTTRVSPAAQEIITALQQGELRMALAISSHSGVWEFTGARLAQMIAPTPVLVAAKLPRNKIIADFLRQVRNRIGLTLVDKNKISRNLVEQKKSGSAALTSILCDQHFNRAGAVRVPFLGKPACTVSIPATLILKYTIPVVIGHCQRIRPGEYLIEFDTISFEVPPTLDMAAKKELLTARINAVLSQKIERAPEQWTWGHRRWRPCCTEATTSH